MSLLPRTSATICHQTTILCQPCHRTQGRQPNRILRFARSDRVLTSTRPGGVLLERCSKANSSVAFLLVGYLYNNSRAYVTATSLSLLSTNDHCHEHSDILINRR